MNNALPQNEPHRPREGDHCSGRGNLVPCTRVPAPLKSIADQWSAQLPRFQQTTQNATVDPAEIGSTTGASRTHRPEVDTHLPSCRGCCLREHADDALLRFGDRAITWDCSAQDVDSPPVLPLVSGNHPTGCRVRHCAGTLIRRASPFTQCRTWLPRRAPRGQLSRPRGRPPAQHRRGRSPPRFPQATTPMVRRWAAATPQRHSGPEGRG